MRKDKLDLHGIRHHMVRGRVIRFVEDRIGGGVHAEVVTGHSQEMKRIVFEVLGEYGIESRDGDFSGRNAGVVEVFIE